MYTYLPEQRWCWAAFQWRSIVVCDHSRYRACLAPAKIGQRSCRSGSRGAIRVVRGAIDVAHLLGNWQFGSKGGWWCRAVPESPCDPDLGRKRRWAAEGGRPNRLTASALSASQGLLSFLPDLAEKQKVRRTGLAAVSLPSGAQPPLSTVSRPQAAAILLPHCCCQI